MNEETQPSGHPIGASASVNKDVIEQCLTWHARAQREAEHLEWKRRQAIQPSAGTLLAPTLPERINRLNPSERHQLSTLIRSLKLRKIIRRTLAEAFWQGEERKAQQALLDSAALGSMPRLRASVRARESLKSYDHALTTFEPEYTRSSHSEGNDSPAIRHALERSIEVLR
jgi:hypothetical protein